ncbi:hypothetical protein ACFL3G_10310 [Planctomycetota bacterium]
MNDIADYSKRCRELDEEYEALGCDLMPVVAARSAGDVGFISDTSDSIIYACVFNAASVTMQDTLFLLGAEADEYCGPIVVIGVHDDWVSDDGKSTRRFLWVDGQGQCNDVVVDEPISFDVVHLIHFKDSDEMKTHRVLTDKFKDAGIGLINPSGMVSQVCDSKFKTFQLLSASNIPTSQTMLFSRFSLTETAEVTERLERFFYKLSQAYPNEKELTLFVQPDIGTEARDVTTFTFKIGQSIKGAEIVNDICKRTEDTVVRLGRGNLFYKEDNPSRVIVRVNVFEGMRPEDLSGYAVVAGTCDEDVVAISQSAEKKSLHLILDNLSYRQGQSPSFTVSPQMVLYSAGRRIYQAINNDALPKDKISLLGIDFTLEAFVHGLTAVAIDVNPRAVIAHSMITTTNKKEKLGLGESYWQNHFGYRSERLRDRLHLHRKQPEKGHYRLQPGRPDHLLDRIRLRHRFKAYRS